MSLRHGSRQLLDAGAVASHQASRAGTRPDAGRRAAPPTADCPVVILCGGQGTRIADVSRELPKPLLPIGEMPIVWHIMTLYGSQGFGNFILCLGHLAERIEAFFGRDVRADGVALELETGWAVTLARTGELTPTGGRLKAVEGLIEGDEFMLTYGDGLSDVDLRCLRQTHARLGRAATVTAVRPRSPFGVLQIEDGLVSSFVEKPLLDHRVNGGFFVFNRRVFDYLTPHEALEDAPLRRMAADGELAVYEHDGFWTCMDTRKDFESLNQLWANGQAPWRLD